MLAKVNLILAMLGGSILIFAILIQIADSKIIEHDKKHSLNKER
ncbi:MAG: hypothetical protein ABIA78_02860 [archaeon]